MSFQLSLGSQPFEAIHAKVHLCMHRLSEQLIRTYNADSLQIRWKQLTEAMEEHFEREKQLMQDLPERERDAHQNSHAHLMDQIQSFSQDRQINIDHFFHLQYEFAKHELEFDSFLEA